MNPKTGGVPAKHANGRENKPHERLEPEVDSIRALAGKLLMFRIFREFCRSHLGSRVQKRVLPKLKPCLGAWAVAGMRSLVRDRNFVGCRVSLLTTDH